MLESLSSLRMGIVREFMVPGVEGCRYPKLDGCQPARRTVVYSPGIVVAEK